MDTTWECVVVGAGAAGLSAALVLGRARRHTLVVDAGAPSNAPAHGIGGLLGHDGRPPAELYALGRDELAVYPTVRVRAGTIEHGEPVDGDTFMLRLAGGEEVRTRTVLLATGMDYGPPTLPGLAELWGRTVFHCPFCHGWEVRDQPLAVLGAGGAAVHRALLLRGWSDDVMLLTDGPPGLDDADLDRLAAAGVRIDERSVTGLIARNGELAEVAFADGTVLPRRGLLVPVSLQQRSSLAAQLGAAAADPGPVAVDPVGVDAFLRTSAPGVFAAGDLSAPFPQIAGAIAAGSQAAAMVVQSLLADEHGLPLPPPALPTGARP